MAVAGEMGLFAVVVKDGEDLRGSLVCLQAVRGHRREFGGFACMHEDCSCPEMESDYTAEDGEPFIAWMYLLVALCLVFGEAHLGDRDAAAVPLP